MKHIKKINEFFGPTTEDNDIEKSYDLVGLTNDDISKADQFIYNISQVNSNSKNYMGVMKYTIPRLRSLSKYLNMNKDILDKLSNMTDSDFDLLAHSKYLPKNENYTYENFTHNDMEMVKELYNDGMENTKDIAREMDLSEETIIQIISSLRKSGQLD